MTKYLLSVHVSGAQPGAAMTEEQMQQSWARIGELEAEMRSQGALVASARLSDAAGAKVTRRSDGRILTTDGPFAESKEHLGGFYIIEAVDLEAALAWASRVSQCIGEPIEVREFAGWEVG